MGTKLYLSLGTGILWAWRLGLPSQPEGLSLALRHRTLSTLASEDGTLRADERL